MTLDDLNRCLRHAGLPPIRVYLFVPTPVTGPACVGETPWQQTDARPLEFRGAHERLRRALLAEITRTYLTVTEPDQ